MTSSTTPFAPALEVLRKPENGGEPGEDGQIVGPEQRLVGRDVGGALAVVARQQSDQGDLPRGKAGQPVVVDQCLRVLVVAGVGDDGSQVVQEGRGVEHLPLARAVPVQRGELVEQAPGEVADVVGVLLLVVVVAGDVEDAEAADVGDDGEGQVLPEMLEEEPLPEAAGRDRQVVEAEAVEERGQHQGPCGDDVGPVRADAGQGLPLLQAAAAEEVDRLFDRVPGEAETVQGVQGIALPCRLDLGEVADGPAQSHQSLRLPEPRYRIQLRFDLRFEPPPLFRRDRVGAHEALGKG